MFEGEGAVFVADHLFGQLDVVVRSLADQDTTAVVEVYDELADLGAAGTVVGHDDEGRVDEAVAVDRVLLAPVLNRLADLRLAHLAAQVVLEVLVAVSGSGGAARGDPVLEAVVVAELD